MLYRAIYLLQPNLLPHSWPFDQREFFTLNVALILFPVKMQSIFLKNRQWSTKDPNLPVHLAKIWLKNNRRQKHPRKWPTSRSPLSLRTPCASSAPITSAAHGSWWQLIGFYVEELDCFETVVYADKRLKSLCATEVNKRSENWLWFDSLWSWST